MVSSLSTIGIAAVRGGGKRELSVELSVTYTVIYCKEYRRFCQFDLSILSGLRSIWYGFTAPTLQATQKSSHLPVGLKPKRRGDLCGVHKSPRRVLYKIEECQRVKEISKSHGRPVLTPAQGAGQGDQAGGGLAGSGFGQAAVREGGPDVGIIVGGCPGMMTSLAGPAHRQGWSRPAARWYSSPT